MDLKFIRTLEMRMQTTGADASASALNKVETAHKGVAQAAATTASATEHAAKSGESLTSSLAKYQRQFDPLLRNQLAFEKVEREMLTLAKHVPEERERANAVIQKAAQHYDALSQAAVISGRAVTDSNKAVAGTAGAFTSHAAGARLARHELINLSRQFQDVGVSLASGQSPLTVMVQQGSQIADVFATSTGTIRGFFSQVTGAAVRFATSTAGIVTGLGAIAATAGFAANSWSTGQMDIERSLSGIGRASGVTRDQINEIGKASSAAFGLSGSEAREAATRFAATGKIYLENTKLATLAVHDFARATGVDATEAGKTLTKALLDPARGALELNKELGFLNATTLNHIQSLQAAGNLQGAMNVLLTAAAPKMKEMAAQTGWVAKSWDFVANAVSAAFDGIGRQATNTAHAAVVIGRLAGISSTAFMDLNEQITHAETKLAKLKASSFQGSMAQPGIKEAAADLGRLVAERERLAKVDPRMNQWTLEAKAATEAIFPQIQNVLKLTEALSALNKAQPFNRAEMDQFGPMAAPTNTEAAQTAYQVQIQLQNESLEKTQRQNTEIQNLGKLYQGVSLEVAKVLEMQKGQLAIASAVTAQEQMAAQEMATINSLRLEGLSLEERTRVAAGERANTQAQINAGADRTLLGLQDQLAVVSAVTGQQRLQAQEQATVNNLVRQGVDANRALAIGAQERINTQAQINAGALQHLQAGRDQLAVAMAVTGQERIMAQGQATYNALIRQGVDGRLASAIAAQQEETAIAQINAQVQQQIDGLRQQTALIEAAARGDEDRVKAAQAYTNAIKAGASESRARELGAATLANSLAKATESASRMADEAERTARALRDAQSISQQLDADFAVGGKSQFGSNIGGTTPALDMMNAQLRASLERFGGESNVTSYISAGGWGAVRPNNAGLEAARRFDLGRLEQAPLGSTIASRNDYGMRLQSGASGGLAADTMLAFNNAIRIAGGVNDKNVSLLQRLVGVTPDEQKGTMLNQMIAAVGKEPATLARAELLRSLNDQLKSLTNSTDSLNSTMGSLLSPYFSQDPRTTKLGFRAGVVGNPDWMAGGTNANPMTAVTGAGSVAANTYGSFIGLDGKLRSGIPGVTGFANGGSFLVPGGYSATDNMMANFPVASGEQVVVNRTPNSQNQPTVIHVNNDNRVIIEGSVDQNTLDKLKRSRFQQLQNLQQMGIG